MRWSLATQLRLGLAVGILLALSVAGAIWWVALDYEHEINQAYETQLRTTVQLAEAQSAFWQLRFGLREFMNASATEKERRQILEQEARWYAIIEERLATYDQAVSSAEERATLTSLRSAYLRYKQARPKFFELWQAGGKDDAMAWLALTVAPFGAEVGRAFETQIALQHSFADQAQAQGQRQVLLALAVVSAITIGLLGMIVFGYVYAVRLLRPIRVLRAQVQGMVRGQLGETIDAATSANEVTALVESFEWMSGRLRAHAESERQARERLDLLLRTTSAIIFAMQPFGDYAVQYISANVRAVLGYEPEEFLRDPGFGPSHIHPDDRERVLTALAVLDTQDTHSDEYRYRHKDGSWRWMHVETRLLRNASGAPTERVGYWIDVTQRVTAEKERERVQERLALALAGGRLAVWDATSSQTVWLSANWADIMGESPGETWTSIEGLVALVHPEERQRLLDAVIAVMKGERPEYVEEHRVRTVTGDWRWLQWRGRVTDRTADGRAARMSGTILDINERKQAEEKILRLSEQLTLTNRALEQTNRMKTDFMANVTHELRTPLNSVIGFAELLADEVPGPLNAKQAAFAADILASGQHLLKLVEGILEMSRLDAADAAIAREPVAIGPALEARVAAYRKAAQARGVTIGLEVAPDASRAQLDPQALRRMLDALIDNAIKFNREGGTVVVRARRNDGWLEIAVADTGVGIAREDQAKLFQPLVQLDAGVARRHGGVGLGLTLARRLVGLHGGTIEVDSEPGKGSTFTLRLPMEDKS